MLEAAPSPPRSQMLDSVLPKVGLNSKTSSSQLLPQKLPISATFILPKYATESFGLIVRNSLCAVLPSRYALLSQRWCAFRRWRRPHKPAQSWETIQFALMGPRLHGSEVPRSRVAARLARRSAIISSATDIAWLGTTPSCWRGNVLPVLCQGGPATKLKRKPYAALSAPGTIAAFAY